MWLDKYWEVWIKIEDLGVFRWAFEGVLKTWRFASHCFVR